MSEQRDIDHLMLAAYELEELYTRVDTLFASIERMQKPNGYMNPDYRSFMYKAKTFEEMHRREEKRH